MRKDAGSGCGMSKLVYLRVRGRRQHAMLNGVPLVFTSADDAVI